MAGIYGADVSTPVSVAQWQALIGENSVSFGIVRCYESSGGVDPNAPASVQSGWAAGLSGVDVYHFPSLGVAAATQVQQAVSALQTAGAKFGSYWFDVECGAGWSTTDLASNATFLSALIAAAEALGLTVGIYTSAGEWCQIIAPGVSTFGAYPLWYAEYETPPNASFSDFTPFGGWTQPAMKQFNGDQCTAGVGFDGNWAPGLPAGAGTSGTGAGGSSSVGSAVVAYATSIGTANLQGGGPTYLPYVSVVATGENLQTQQSMSTVSSCGLAVSGIWTACGYYGAALNAPYVIGTAVSRLLQIGQAAGAYVAYTPGPLPSPGDMVLIGESTSETHVYTVISVTPRSGGAVIQSVDGGQPGAYGSCNAIANCTHTWQNGQDTDAYYTRTINGWIEVAKVLTSGVTPLSGWVQAAPPGTRGADTVTAISASAAAALAAAGVSFCVRYVSPNQSSVTPLTASEAQGILGANLGLMLAQSVDASALTFSTALGTQHGQAAAASAQSIGFPMCAVVWLVLDALPASTAPSVLTSYYGAWYTAVHAAGYLPGLCVGAAPVLTAAQLGGLAFSNYWQASGATVSPSPRGYQLVQGSATTCGGVQVTADTAQNDQGYPGTQGPNQAQWLIATPLS